MIRYLVCYDIADDRRRNAVARTLESFGHRLHESVFECDLRPAQLARLVSALRSAIDAVQDKVTVYPVCERDLCDLIHLGNSRGHTRASAVSV